LHIGSNLPPKDNLRKEDKSSAPKVSFIRRFHCIGLGIATFLSLQVSGAHNENNVMQVCGIPAILWGQYRLHRICEGGWTSIHSRYCTSLLTVGEVCCTTNEQRAYEPGLLRALKLLTIPHIVTSIERYCDGDTVVTGIKIWKL